LEGWRKVEEERILEIKLKDGTTVYVFTCPICGKQIRSLSRSQLQYNALTHRYKHREEK
jgi:predicted RNA-binding Zn-ribbon protein involved in translation (DUF1610 family)